MDRGVDGKGVNDAHLDNMNQPSTGNHDENSLGSSKMFDSIEEIEEKPLLAAALKAQKQNDDNMDESLEEQLSVEDKGVDDVPHLDNMNQPSSDHDEKSLESSKIFDLIEEIEEKPLLAAAL